MHFSGIEWHQKIDGINAVLIPTLLALTVGILLALYTGLVASRIFAFHQARYRCLAWLTDLADFTSDKFSSPQDFQWKLAMRMQPLAFELRGLGHEQAKDVILRIHNSALEAAAAALGVVLKDGTMLPKGASEHQVDIARIATLRHLNRNRNANVAAISAMPPSLFALIQPMPFPNYLSFRGQFIGLNIRRLSAAEILWHELKNNSSPKGREILEFAGRRSDCSACCANCKDVL